MVSYDARDGPATHALARASDGRAPAGRSRSAPFRGLRFDPDTVGDLATVISPPYDVLDADTVRDLESANRRNIVRLILSRRFERPYLAVRDRLQKWRDKALPARRRRAGAVPLRVHRRRHHRPRPDRPGRAARPRTSGVILPHEDVMPAPGRRPHRADAHHRDQPRADPAGPRGHRAAARRSSTTPRRAAPAGRLRRPRRQRAPALGRHRRRRATHAIARRAAPAPGADRRRPPPLRRLPARSRPSCAARTPRRTRRPGTSGWRCSSTSATTRSRIGPIHRSVAALTMSDVAETSPTSAATSSTAARRPGDRVRRARPRRRPTRTAASFVVSDGRAWAVLRDQAHPRRSTRRCCTRRCCPPGTSPRSRSATTTASTRRCTPPPGSRASWSPCSRRSSPRSWRPRPAGVRMPRKSTSFAPKPRMGVVMRDLRDA